jgi:hypothetical protein
VIHHLAPDNARNIASPEESLRILSRFEAASEAAEYEHLTKLDSLVLWLPHSSNVQQQNLGEHNERPVAWHRAWAERPATEY